LSFTPFAASRALVLILVLSAIAAMVCDFTAARAPIIFSLLAVLAVACLAMSSKAQLCCFSSSLAFWRPPHNPAREVMAVPTAKVTMRLISSKTSPFLRLPRAGDQRNVFRQKKLHHLGNLLTPILGPVHAVERQHVD
jgi:hypothetical protein